ncbi:MAG: (Na+)-NQR maturation NqrM [Parahaliea sp.]
MTTFLVSTMVFALVMAAMAVGVMAGREPIKGSCGGIGALGIDRECGICGGDPVRCETETRKPKSTQAGTASEALFYNADTQSHLHEGDGTDKPENGYKSV